MSDRACLLIISQRYRAFGGKLGPDRGGSSGARSGTTMSSAIPTTAATPIGCGEADPGATMPEGAAATCRATGAASRGASSASLASLRSGDAPAARTGAGVPEIDALLDGQVSLLTGHSGVGKSTLINALVPDLDLKTAEISAFSDKGVHTTTFAEMLEVRPGTYLIDTPGIKELGLVDVKPAELAGYFPEMRALLNQCRYHNCQHTHEPGCAVREAVDHGRIALPRYDSYLSMLAGEDNRH